jgi:hypothetical protein
MVLVGVISFCAFMALSAYAPDLRSGSDGGAHALSKSAVGFAGLVELLQAEGAPVEVSRGSPPPAPPKPGSGVLVLTPTPSAEPKEIAALHFQGAVLLVLPKWIVAPKPLQDEWVDKAGLFDGRQVAAVLRDLAPSTLVERRKGVSQAILTAARGQSVMSGDGKWGQVESLQTIAGAGWTPILVDETGKTVLAQSKTRRIFVLSDPDLINTHGLADALTARSASEILGILRHGGPVIFDVTLNGFKRGRGLLRLALEPPLLGVTLCLLTAAALMGLHAAGRFGPPARPERALALGQRALADNSAALVRMAKREHRMAEGYAVLAREAAAKSVSAPRDLGSGQLDAVLDRLGASRGAHASFSELMVRARGARTNAELMAVARQLFQWKTEMTRDGR